MKMNRMRTAAALMTAAIVMTTLSGCGKDGGSPFGGNGGGSKKGKLEVSLDHAYAGEKLAIEGMENPQGGLSLGDKVLIVGWDKDYKEIMMIYDPATGSTQNAEFAYPKTLSENANAYPNSYFLDKNGNFDVLFSGSSWEKDENGEEQYESLGLTLEIYDKDFNVIETRSLKDAFGEGVYVDTVAPNPAGGYVISMWDSNVGSQIIGLYDEDFKKTGDVQANFNYINGIYPTDDGAIYIGYDDGQGSMKFGTIDAASGTVNPVNVTGMPSWFNNCFPSRDDKYDVYLYDSEYIYGINAAAGICEPVVNWLNSDFLGNYVGEVVQLDDGRFMLGSQSMGNNPTTDVWVLSPRDPEEFKNVKVISLAGIYIPDETAQAVLNFNRTHNDIRIATVSYEKYSTEDDYEAGLKKFKNDMTAGIVADLILTIGTPYESLANKGIFLDLTDRMSAYTDADYFTNVFDTLKYGDKLYHVGFSYNVETLVGKEELVGSKSGLSSAEFMQIIKNLPAGTEAFNRMSKSGAVSTLISSNVRNFVDTGAGTCNFNTQEFVEMLEFCNTFPSDEEMEQFWNNPDPSYWEEQQYQYLNGKVAFSSTWLYNLRYAYQNQITEFDKATVTRVGYPTNSGGNGGRFNISDTLAISSNSQYKDECWDFLASMLDDEYQNSLNWTLPVSRKAFEKQVEAAMKPETYTDANGKEVEIEPTIWRGEEEIKIPQMPQSYADELKTYIEGIRDMSYYDMELMEIIEEEAGKFFAGDQSAQQAADMIQSRASLYLSEQS